MSQERESGIGFWSATGIGIGGMVGGGIFAVLGLAVQLAHGGTPVAFLLAGLVALITARSYARLSVAFPGEGGSVEFINRAFGPGLLTGSLNVLLWLSYVIMLSLYAHAFGSYGVALLPEGWQGIGLHALISLSIVLLTILNAAGSRLVGEAEEWIVGFKVAILLLFIFGGFWSVQAGRLAPSEWTSLPELVAGGMIIFLAYEGFELIANTAADVQDAKRNLPRAYMTSVIFVIVLYVLVSLVTVGNLPVTRIVQAKDYALAEGARPFLGGLGFDLIAVAAVLSTASAINATLYGTARISYVIAKDGELPRFLERKIWRRPLEGLVITAAVTLAMANLFDLGSISMMGSAGFLLVFAAVNLAALRLRGQTGSSRWLPALGAASCLIALAVLIWQRALTAPEQLGILAAMIALSFAVEAVYRLRTGRSIHLSRHRARDGR